MKINLEEIFEIQTFLSEVKSAYEETVENLDTIIDDVDEYFDGQSKRELKSLLDDVKDEFEDRYESIEELEEDIDNYESNVIDEYNVTAKNDDGRFTISEDFDSNPEEILNKIKVLDDSLDDYENDLTKIEKIRK